MARPKQDIKKISKSVTLSQETLDVLTLLGKGNISAGVEEAVKGCIAFRALTNQPPLELKPNKK